MVTTTKRQIANDIIIDMICRIESMLNQRGATDDMEQSLLTLEKDLRATWGGDRVYISHRRGELDNRLHSERNSRIWRAHQQGVHTAWLAKKENLTERRVLQIINSGSQKAQN